MTPRKADLSRWLFTAGRLSLDFVGTVGHRPAEHVERLTDPGALRRWLLEAGLPALRLTPTDQDLERARAVREALNELIGSRVDADPAGGPEPVAPPAEDSLALLNRVAAVPPPAPRVSLDPTGRTVSEWIQQDHVDPLLSAIIRDALDLIDGSLRGQIRRCAAEDCRKLFLDTAPRPRRWCSARACGTRRRVAAHRARQARGAEVVSSAESAGSSDPSSVG